MEKLDVLFRRSRRKEPAGLAAEVTAVFPSECGTDEYDFTCYAHVGQHSSADRGWYNKTRKAKPAEYADLLAELRQIYAPEYELVVRSRMTRRGQVATTRCRRALLEGLAELISLTLFLSMIAVWFAILIQP